MATVTIDEHPVIVIDTREQTPLPIGHLKSVPGTLTSGDYSVSGFENRFSVERKSLPDLIASLTSERERFERECHRLRGYTFARLLIVGDCARLADLLKRRKTGLRSIIGSLGAIEARFSLPVVWAATPEAAAQRVENWAWWFYREQVRPLAALQTPAFVYGAPDPAMPLEERKSAR